MERAEGAHAYPKLVRNLGRRAEVQAVRSKIIHRCIALAAIAVPLAACDEGALDPHGPIGQRSNAG
jgi:hypothetical protein